MYPFLEVGPFEIMFGRALSGAEQSLAELVLPVASDWIRDRKAGIADDDPTAQLVVFEVTRDVLMYGKYGGLASFSETMGPRTKSGTINQADVEKFVTDRHRRMLGLPVVAAARGSFKECDY